MKRKVYKLVFENERFSKFIYWLIILNVISLIFESYQSVRNDFGYFLHLFEIFSITVFTLEYFARIWTADLHERFGGGFFMSRLRFVFSGMGLVDLIAILPFYLPFFFPFDLRVVRILRLLRLLRILKLGRHSKSIQTVFKVFEETKGELSMTLFLGFILLVLSSTLMFYIESEAQPDKFSSIGQSFWWAINTVTTVGYGDVYPVTNLGKVLSAVIALLGIGFVALPTGIISSAYIEKIQLEKVTPNACQCPSCGHVFRPELNKAEESEENI